MSWDKIETKFKCDCGKGFEYHIDYENDFFDTRTVVIFTCYECYKNYKEPNPLSLYKSQDVYSHVDYKKDYKGVNE